MVITFPYQSKNPLTDPLSLDPVIRIELQSGDHLLALVDSGADISAIPLKIAQLLGLPLQVQDSQAQGVGGYVSTARTHIQLTIKDEKTEHEIHLPISVILDDIDFPFLLGRKGFFDKFVICFDETERKVMLHKN